MSPKYSLLVYIPPDMVREHSEGGWFPCCQSESREDLHNLISFIVLHQHGSLNYKIEEVTEVV